MYGQPQYGQPQYVQQPQYGQPMMQPGMQPGMMMQQPGMQTQPMYGQPGPVYGQQAVGMQQPMQQQMMMGTAPSACPAFALRRRRDASRAVLQELCQGLLKPTRRGSPGAFSLF